MKFNEWLKINRANFDSHYEALFAEKVLPLISEIKYESISTQYPFKDIDEKQRYCDFVIQERNNVRIAIEIDGYDKRGTGMGMSHTDFIDWQRRQAALTSQGWYVLRFANRDVRDEPQRCAEHIRLLLRHSRAKTTNQVLNDRERKRLDELTTAQNNRMELIRNQNERIDQLSQQASVTKKTVIAFAILILCFLSIIVWQGSDFTSMHFTKSINQPLVTVNSSELEQQLPIQTRKANQIIPKGATCDNPISWQEVGQHTGQTAAVVGPLMRVTSRNNVQGNPTWIEIGATYPNPQRLVLLIWGEKKSNFPNIQPGVLDGRTVCAVGEINIFRNTPQITLSKTSQFKILNSQTSNTTQP